MAGIVITSVRRGGAGCDHRNVTVNLDGQSFTIDTGEGQLDAIPWTDVEKLQFITLGLKRLRVLEALALDNAPGRVSNGEEGTNVKQFGILGKDVTKTNIGTTYVDVSPGLNGERALIEFTGCTQFRLLVNVNMIGTGPLNFRIIRDSDSAELFVSPNVSTAGEKEYDSGWQNLPAQATGQIFVRFQAKSVTAADDPIFRRCIMFVK